MLQQRLLAFFGGGAAVIRMSRSVEKEKEISFQGCNYLHQEFKAWTYGSLPPPAGLLCTRVSVWQQNGFVEGRGVIFTAVQLELHNIPLTQPV